LYIGQVNHEGIPHGYGIRIKRNVVIQEGYWNDGQRQGRARVIGNSWYEIREYKDQIDGMTVRRCKDGSEEVSFYKNGI
jgi:hypothetical protein